MSVNDILFNGIKRSSYIKNFKEEAQNPIIEQALHLHQERITVKIIDIKEENSLYKTFVLKYPSALPYFKAGMYIDVYYEATHRPYTITSSPKDALNGIYEITVKNYPNGLVSSYLFSLSINDSLSISSPRGEFSYNKIRDYKNVVAIAGGSGVTPFIAMAKAINENIDDYSLTILYGVNKEEEIVEKNVLDELSKNSKINIIYIVLDNNSSSFISGYIREELLRKYINKETSVFVCGPTGLVNHIKEELKVFALPIKNVRYEVQGVTSNNPHIPHKLRIYKGPKEYEGLCYEDESLLKSIENMNILIKSSCRGGVCSLCHSFLVSGMVSIDKDKDFRRAYDIEANYIHPCVTFPKSDIELEIPDVRIE